MEAEGKSLGLHAQTYHWVIPQLKLEFPPTPLPLPDVLLQEKTDAGV
jgi:hypothetical protein